MTSHWCDFQNTDVILHCGSNSVENHPVSSLWLGKAHDRGAKWIVVDPRYTRTAEQADIYCPIRSGTDIAFYGGMYHWIIENLIDPNLEKYLATGEMGDYNYEYLLNYTNASYLLDPEFDFDPETGLYSGWDEKTKTYSNHSWHYQTEKEENWDTSASGDYAWVKKDGVPEFTTPTLTLPKRDMTLQDPMCVYQQVKKHYERYTLDAVCDICGMDKETLELVYSTYGSTAKPGRAGMVLYALGQTQHSYGAQNTRAMCVMQLLLGNIGIPGGGVNALRGEPNVQGATDMGMMVNEHPAYLKWANTTDRSSLRKWLESQTYSAGYYTNKPKFIVSSLKEWFGDAATVENDYGYDWWPKVPSEKGDQDYTHISTFELMKQGVIKGYFNWGMNPCHSAPNAGNVRRSMANLDWLVVADQVETESAAFWKAPDMNPAEIQTTVYFLPCALIYEKPGTILNSGRWLQWRYQAVEPWDQAKPDLEMCDLLWTEICRLYKEEGGANPDPILNTKWDYYVNGKIDFASGFLGAQRLPYGQLRFQRDEKPKVDLLKGYSELGADGSTSCAMWIYSGFYNNNDAPLDPAQQPIGRRDNNDKSGLGLNSNWAFSWPSNRRILYNRNSCDTKGKPWNPDKKLMEWDGEQVGSGRPGRLRVRQERPTGSAEQQHVLHAVGAERASGILRYGRRPDARALRAVRKPVRQRAQRFAEQPDDQVRRNTSPPLTAELTSTRSSRPRTLSPSIGRPAARARSCPALVEAMPSQFCEMSEEFAAEKGIKPGDKVRVWNKRGSVVVRRRTSPSA